MIMSLTPKQFRSRNFLKFNTPSPSSSFKSPLINRTEKKIKLEDEKLSIEDLKEKALELWKKCEDKKQEIQKLKNEGYKEEQLKWYIDKLHEYNEIKDIAQMVMGKLAIIEETTVRDIHDQFGMSEKD